jgi:decaprenylphospho-beta-D-ribofuranose 2-oxidase
VSEAFSTQQLSGWGRMNPDECRVFRPEKYRNAVETFLAPDGGSIIPRGLGRSYGDPSVNGGGRVLDMTRQNRMLAFDETRGVVECEAGVSLEALIEAFLPRGYFLPVSPGTKFVTVGGAIANDIHGKNHHVAGSFGQFVEELTLLTPTGETLVCTPEQNSDVFWATVGGVGLTGLILTAKVRLKPVPSAWISVDYYKSRDLDDALATMADSDDRYIYSVAWVDCLASGSSLGRSVLMRGNHATLDQLGGERAARPYHVKHPMTKTVPFDFPGFVLNPLSMRAFNEAIWAVHKTQNGTLVDYDKYFYPLDSVHHWNRGYGKKGFAQFQATLPPQSKQGLVKLLEKLSGEKRASFLAVLKCFGDGNPGLLSHPMKGYTLTLDIPNAAGLPEFMKDLDRILLDYGGRLYFAKDSLSDAATIEKMYPRLPEFRAIQKRLDPQGRLSSNLARRLGLVEGA